MSLRLRQKSTSIVTAARCTEPVLDVDCLSAPTRTRIIGFMFSNPSALLGSLLFGAVGFVAFMYGKKMVLWKPMVFGVALMAYPYFVPQTWLMYSIGCALCLGLYFFRG